MYNGGMTSKNKENEMRIESHENLYTEILSYSDCCGEHCSVVEQEWILEKI